MNADKIKAIIAEMWDALENDAYFDEDVIYGANGEIEDETGGWVVTRESMARFVRRIDESLKEDAP